MTEARRILRLQPYSMHTERAYVEWMVRFVWFHAMRSRDDLFPAALKSAAFLTDLALNGNGAAATQHQAMHALVFLSTHVLHQALEDRMNAVRADKTITVPVVITRDEVATVLALSAFLRHTFAATRYGYSDHSAPARAHGCGHHHDLHPRRAARGPGRAEPLGRSGRVSGRRAGRVAGGLLGIQRPRLRAVHGGPSLPTAWVGRVHQLTPAAALPPVTRAPPT